MTPPNAVRLSCRRCLSTYLLPSRSRWWERRCCGWPFGGSIAVKAVTGEAGW